MTYSNNVNLKLTFHKVASFHPHYLTFTHQTYHHPVHRFRSWSTQTTLQSHLRTQVRVQPRKTYNHTYIKFLPGQKNKLILNPDKTTYTLFTSDPAEYTSNLYLTINNKALPMAMHPKVLSLTIDHFKFPSQIAAIAIFQKWLSQIG